MHWIALGKVDCAWSVFFVVHPLIIVNGQLLSFDDWIFCSSFECSLLSPQTCITLFVGEPIFIIFCCFYTGGLNCRNCVDHLIISGQILVSTVYVLILGWVTKSVFSLYFLVQPPQLVRSSISPTGLVDPSTTQWSMEFDRQVLCFYNWLYSTLLSPSTRYKCLLCLKLTKHTHLAMAHMLQGDTLHVK